MFHALEVLGKTAGRHRFRAVLVAAFAGLAAARAMAGLKTDAIDALDRAVRHGFRNAKQLETDPRFAPLRGMLDVSRIPQAIAGRR